MFLPIGGNKETEREIDRIKTKVSEGSIPQSGGSAPRNFRRLKIDANERQVSVGDQVVQLSPAEYRILSLLVANAGRVLAHQFLLAEVWVGNHTGGLECIRRCVQRLRVKLESAQLDPSVIVTIPGVGYMFTGQLS